MGDIRYLRGPGPRHLRPKSPPPAPPAAPVERPVQPTYWLQTVNDALVVNPNVCEVCHCPPHPATAHHAFEPDRATPAMAKKLGWPLPAPIERLI